MAVSAPDKLAFAGVEVLSNVFSKRISVHCYSIELGNSCNV